MARLLREGDPEALTLLADVCEAMDGDLSRVAEALGFAGRSTLYRIKYASDAVSQILEAFGRPAGRAKR